jgi:hypothetical protein
VNKHKELIPLFKTQCGYEIDEDDFSDDQAEDMRSAAVYWAIGKGLSPKDAREFARTVVYGVEE